MSKNMKTAAVILAAGKGKRMKSDLPKILHQLDGRYLVDYVINSARQAGIGDIILVIGYKHELVREKLADKKVKFVVQEPQLGTGHAVQIAVPELAGFDGDLLVLCGDMPFITSTTMKRLIETRRHTESAATVLTVKLDNPGSYGRIVRDREGYLEAIVEFKDAGDDIRQIKEVNTGAYCFDFKALLPVLKYLKAENVQSEYYLTDTISLFKRKGLRVSALITDNANEGLGVNSQEELTAMETIIKEQS